MRRRAVVPVLLLALPAAAQFLHTDAASRDAQGPEAGTLLAGNNDGSAKYRYDFRLPPARGRYQPMLALSYSSNGGNGPYGVGWALGLSYVESRARAAPDASGNPRKQYWLVLNGARKLLVPYPANQSTIYRPDVGTGYLIITRTTDSTGRPVAWSMVDGVGNQYSFESINSGSPTAYGRWYLRRVVDVDGNTALYEYNPESGVVGSSGMLVAIRYNNYGAYGDFANVVELSYTNNPNPQLEAIGTAVVLHTQLLNAVAIKRKNPSTGTLGLLYKYTIAYVQSAATARQLVNNIVMVGQDGLTKLDLGTTFGYTGDGNGYGVAPSQHIPALTGPAALINPTQAECGSWLALGTCNSGLQCTPSHVAALIDIDADGRADMVWGSNMSGSAGSTSGLRWARNTSTPGNVSFAPVEILPGSETWLGMVSFNNAGGDSSPPGRTRMIDVDGDGRPDLVTANSPNCPPAAGSTQTTQFEVRFNRDDSSPARAGLPMFSPYVCMDASAALADWNVIGAPTTSPTNMMLAAQSQGNTRIDLVDLTGDGIVDYVVATSNGWHVYPGYQNAAGGWAFGAAITYFPAGPQPSPIRKSGNVWGEVTQDLVDVNGDGLRDLVTSSLVTSSSGVTSATWTVQYNAGPAGGFVNRPDQPSQLSTWVSGNSAVLSVSEGNSPSSAVYFYSGSLVDLNNDGLPDYVYGPSSPYPPTPCANSAVTLNTGLGFASNSQCTAINSPVLSFVRTFSLIHNGSGDPSQCMTYDQNGRFVDIDGDGVMDYYYFTASTFANATYTTNLGPSNYLRGTSPRADLLSQVVSPLGATLSISYASAAAFARGSGRIAYVVSQTKSTGPGLQALTTNYTYANPSIISAWDESTRREHLGYLDTYSQDSVTLITVHRQWGSTHDTAGQVVKEERATSSTFGGGFSASAVFEQSTHVLASWSIAYGNCAANMSPAPAMPYPVLVFDSAATHSLIEGGATFTKSTSVACTSLDSAGNVLARTIVPDSSAPSYIVFARYPDPTDSTSRCKSCILESWASTSPNGADLFRQRFHYDAPLGTSDPAAIAVTTGHLNYVEELVSGSGSSGNFEIGNRLAYNADGTIASVRKDFAGQDVSSVSTTYLYDQQGLNVTQEKLSDIMTTGVLSVTIIGDRTYDPATGLLASMTGPYLSGSQAGPTMLFAYDLFGRLTDIGRQDGASKVEMAAYGYNFAGQVGSGSPGSVSWSASFAGQVAFPAARPLPTTDDIMLETTFYDAIGRSVQRRRRLGTGSPGAAGQIIQHLATQYLVNAVVLDGAGRPTESLDPYYSSNSAFQDLNNGQTTELSTVGLHGTGFSYDAKSRLVCTVYWPVTGAITAAPSPCTSNFSSTGYRRATATSYGSETISTSNYLTVDQIPDWRNTTSPPPVSPRRYLNASGWTVYTRDANLNLVALQHDVLGRTSAIVRYAGGVGATPSISTSSLYDLKGRVVQQMDDSYGTRVFTYSATGELVKIGLNPTAAIPEGQSGVQFRYGSLGRLENRWSFTWSKTGMNACGGGLYVRTPSTPSTVPPDASSYFYDSPSYSFTAGRLSSQTNGIVTTNFGYDWAGRVLVRDSAFKDSTDSLGNPFWHSINQALGNDGRLLATTVRSPLLGSPVQYLVRYDSFPRPVQIDDAGTPLTIYWVANNPAAAPPLSPSYDSLARLTNSWLDNGAATHVYQFDSASNLEIARASSVTQAGQTAPNSLYNATGKTSLGTKLTGYSEAVSGNMYSYSYDTDGRLAQFSARPATAPSVAGAQQNVLEAYSHFLSGGTSLWTLQTVSDQLSNVTATYSYPPQIGRCTTGASSCEQLISIAYSAPAPAISPPQDSYTYDVNGRVVAHYVGTATAPVQQFSYDPEGRLTQISGPSGSEQLAYDCQGGLAVRYQGAAKTIYVGADMTIRINGTVQTASVHILLGGTRIATRPAAGPVLYYHIDHLGSIIATSLAGGTAGAIYRYGAYGTIDKIAGETSTNASELGYTGALKLSEGLLYLSARVYNPQMRKFLVPDNMDHRRYTYAGGDPANRIDPTGHGCEEPGECLRPESGGGGGDPGDGGGSGDPGNGGGDIGLAYGRQPGSICGPGDNCSTFWVNPDYASLLKQGNPDDIIGWLTVTLNVTQPNAVPQISFIPNPAFQTPADLLTLANWQSFAAQFGGGVGGGSGGVGSVASVSAGYGRGIFIGSGADPILVNAMVYGAVQDLSISPQVRELVANVTITVDFTDQDIGAVYNRPVGTPEVTVYSRTAQTATILINPEMAGLYTYSTFLHAAGHVWDFYTGGPLLGEQWSPRYFQQAAFPWSY